MLFAPPYLIARAGHSAVVIFFVLSGYLISGSVFRMFAAGRWSWKRYSLHRLLRLWIVLIPGLMLTALCDQTGIHLHRAPAQMLYSGASGNHMLANVHLTSAFLLRWGMSRSCKPYASPSSARTEHSGSSRMNSGTTFCFHWPWSPCGQAPKFFRGLFTLQASGW